MKLTAKLCLVLILLLLASPVILLKGCGNENIGVADCPSGSVVAMSTDILTAPGDDTLIVLAPSFGGTVPYAPLVFNVTDSGGKPRNKVCVILYTDGFFYTDDTYSTVIPGVGLMSRVAKMTDDTGSVVMYWSTELLPASGTTSISSDTWVIAYSGSKQAEYNVVWTVNSLTALSITTTSPLDTGTVGTPYSVVMAATGGTIPYTWSDSGGLPPGLTLNPGTGVISGTPTLAGTYNFTITVTDSVPNSVLKSFTIVVS